MEYIAHVRGNGDRQSLQDHLSGVGVKASDNLAKIGLSKQGELLGLLHDLGKYSDEFQNYIKSATNLLNQDEDEEYVDADRLRGRIDHSTAGAQLIWNELRKQGPQGEMIGQILALCIASHHSGLIDCLGSSSNDFGHDVFRRRMLKADERTHLAEVANKADAEILSKIEAILADARIVSNLWESIIDIARRDCGGVVAQQKIGLLVRFLFSGLIDADRLDTASFEKERANRHRPHGSYTPWPILIDRLEQRLAALPLKAPVDQLRRDISAHCLDAAGRDKGIFTLSVPTGGGKTLASLRFALHHAKGHGMDRIIYLIPFTSIIDQNAEVVRGIIEPEGERGSVVLEHHGNLTPEVQGWREKMLTENWDAPVIYTTMVQFLETLFGNGTRGARRMHQLANAVLIFDEIQSLPIKCVHLFNNAINFFVDHCGSTAVLCTATQPLLDKVSADKGAIRLAPGSELMPDVSGLFDALKRVEVIDSRRSGGWPRADIAALAQAEVGRSGSCLVIVNTKEAARELYRRCCHASADFPVFHLSTSLCPAHRKTILADVRARLDTNECLICVSTQLIEAGVDVDFGSVIRFAAGLDAIAQAAGRCNRNGKRATGRVHVVNPRPEDENLDKLPDIRIGREKAERVLSDYAENPACYCQNLLGPEAMNWYYQNYFHARHDEMDYPLGRSALGHDDSLLELLSGNRKTSAEFGKRNPGKPQLPLRQSFMAAAKAFKAIDAPTQAVIVPYDVEGKVLINDLGAAFEVEKQFALLRRAQQYSVNVFPHELAKLQNAGAIFPVQKGTAILHLDPRYYSPDFGLVTEPVGLMETHYV
jgi:CRISPR-associated endonuclease/helicase Cas3